MIRFSKMHWTILFKRFYYYYYYLIVINIFLPTRIHSTTEINVPGGYFEIIINYTNPESTTYNGFYCDWHLHKCDVYMILELYKITFNNSGGKLFRVKTKSMADTANFRLKVSNKINERLPEKYRLELYVYDEDALGEHDLITVATGLYQPEKTNVFQTIPLNYSHISDSFSLGLSIRLTCNSNYYGNKCDLFCSPHPWAYDCDENGRKICLHGRHGVNCDIIDYCKIHPCPKNTRCKNLPREHRRKCICKNHGGPECHSVYYSCEKSPCKNGGRCTLLRELIGDNNAEGFIHTNQGTNDDDDETICSCPDNWSGQFCTEPVIDCISENEKYRLSTTRLTSRFCLNGGVCIIHPGNSSPRCSCPPEWDGYFCELNKSWSAGRIFGIAFSIIFVIFLILVIGFFVWLCYMSRHPNIPQHPAITYLSNYPYNSTISDNDSHKSTRVYMKHEKIFDIPKSNHSPVKLSTFGDNSNPRMDTQKMENIYELPYTTNKTKQNDVNFNSLDRNGSPFTTIQSINENIYVNYDTLMSKELQNDLSNI